MTGVFWPSGQLESIVVTTFYICYVKFYTFDKKFVFPPSDITDYLKAIDAVCATLIYRPF